MRFLAQFFATTLRCGLTGVVTIGTISAHAQDSSASFVGEKFATPAPSDRFDTITSNIATSLDVSEEKSEASASIGGSLAVTGDAQTVQDAVLWKLGVDVPIGGGDDLFKDSTLDALANSLKFTAGLSFSHYRNDPKKLESEAYSKLLQEAFEKCFKKASTSKTLQQECALGLRTRSEDFIHIHLPDADLRLARALYSGFYTIGFKGSVGFKELDYVQPGSIDEKTAKRTEYSAALSAAYYPSDAVSTWRLEAEYAHAYETEDKAVVCKPVVTDPTNDCVYSAPGEPKQKDSLIGRFEYRRFFPVGTDNAGVGIAPTGSYDALSGDVGAELPVYFVIANESVISPGIKFAYTRDASKTASEDEEFTVSLFLKASFDYK
ncbi:hypothetical protein N5J77_09405 [Sphingobium yanoikuyae]|uniref:Uncharacterized protein n=1 Tax=Sphingobium yanoikuyae TaxID=13690 RepID=A0AA42WVK8_SPHYA|nr:hypothetical protein [Sphingobium yanoikuyae]MDH2131336.1 hypothetical protein [Sphingobium yanoikuyae]MDH2151979.1 hypothetical protein [Sphingobium yanoikuyae]MDH2168344.1 hypothetical protein [Sphingobium yanoikuyae]